MGVASDEAYCMLVTCFNIKKKTGILRLETMLIRLIRMSIQLKAVISHELTDDFESCLNPSPSNKLIFRPKTNPRLGIIGINI